MHQNASKAKEAQDMDDEEAALKAEQFIHEAIREFLIEEEKLNAMHDHFLDKLFVVAQKHNLFAPRTARPLDSPNTGE